MHKKRIEHQTTAGKLLNCLLKTINRLQLPVQHFMHPFKDLIVYKVIRQEDVHHGLQVFFVTNLFPSPGHEISSLHDCVSELLPGQLDPRNAGGGLEQVRDRTCVPPPHEREHLPQAFHAAHLPSTAQIAKSIILANSYFIALYCLVVSFAKNDTKTRCNCIVNFLPFFSNVLSTFNLVVDRSGEVRGEVCLTEALIRFLVRRGERLFYSKEGPF